MAAQLTQEAVLDALRSIIDPDLGQDIVSLGFIKELEIRGGHVSFKIEMTTPACPMRERFKSQASECVSAVPGVTSVDVAMTARVRPTPAQNKDRMIPGVRNVVCVASGKGGVGKSTVTANLALALARSGARVGVLDADIYGPSIPLIMGVTENPKVTEEPQRIIPPVKDGVKVMSMGFFLEEGQAVVWRGPLLTQVMHQFLGDVEWGELDYLLVDLPPGTGDIQLTICQTIPVSGAVIVSTPQDVALKVAQKAIDLFRMLQCPILGMIENMSHFTCPHCGKREDIFGSGGVEKASKAAGIPFVGGIPLVTAVREASDSGRPVVLSAPDSAAAVAFREAAEKLAAQVSTRNAKAGSGG